MKTQDTIAFITQSGPILKTLSNLKLVIDTNNPILITGETGVGKDLLAEYIHRNSVRRNRTFIKVALSAIPPDLLESELFGHEKGAYTSASNDKKGPFELANGSSIFLDDIDDFPLFLQSKLLRVLESGEVKRIGAEKAVRTDFRLITATKLDLKKQVEKGHFRADLFYRLNVLPVILPPLREHPEDIPILVDYFIEMFAPDKHVSVSPEVVKILQKYNWPGNVRELKNVMHRMVLFSIKNNRRKYSPGNCFS